MYLFDKPTSMTVKQWESSKVIQIMLNIDTHLWIPFTYMSIEEKEKYPKAESTEGYLKQISIKEAWLNAWNN